MTKNKINQELRKKGFFLELGGKPGAYVFYSTLSEESSYGQAFVFTKQTEYKNLKPSIKIWILRAKAFDSKIRKNMY